MTKNTILLPSLLLLAAAALATPAGHAESVERLKYGDFEQWVTRNIKESRLIGGKMRQAYEIAPAATIDGDVPYTNRGGSPWATSNVMAKVAGITKVSNAVFPDRRADTGSGVCRMTTMMEHCKALGLVNIDVVVAGSIFLGHFVEPVKSTADPYSKMEMGIPFTRRPKALRFDYRLDMPQSNERVYSSGFGSKKKYPGHDSAEVFVILQRRWEDADGNLYAARVGTGREHLTRDTGGKWVNDHDLAVHYGDITAEPFYKPFMGLIPKDKSYYATNSRGKMVPVTEVQWDAPGATPTHILVMASAGSGTAYIGTLGLTLWVDNMSLVF